MKARKLAVKGIAGIGWKQKKTAVIKFYRYL
jgi:hypothetical protein